MWFRNVWTVCGFEFRRTLTWRRLLLTFALAMFPVMLICLVQFQGAHLERDDRGELSLFFLVPGVVCILGSILWATGVIHSELEEKTWTYLALRPVGRGAILTGKYCSAVAWTSICAMISLVACLAVLLAFGDRLTHGPSLALLAILSTAAYSAVFVLLGVLFPSRAMVAAVAYTAVMESIVAWLPAAINRFSVLFHLRCLFADWLLDASGTHGPGFDSLFFDTMTAEQHLAVLIGIVATFLSAAAIILRRRQLMLSADQ
jgi:ABC-type transport system involved in multi-copper enzyme maturation permease subunit